MNPIVFFYQIQSEIFSALQGKHLTESPVETRRKIALTSSFTLPSREEYAWNLQIIQKITTHTFHVHLTIEIDIGQEVIVPHTLEKTVKFGRLYNHYRKNGAQRLLQEIDALKKDALDLLRKNERIWRLQRSAKMQQQENVPT